MAHEIVSKPSIEVEERIGAIGHLAFILRAVAILIALVLLSCTLVVLNCISVFAVSTALEDLPVSEILLEQS